MGHPVYKLIYSAFFKGMEIQHSRWINYFDFWWGGWEPRRLIHTSFINIHIQENKSTMWGWGKALFFYAFIVILRMNKHCKILLSKICRLNRCFDHSKKYGDDVEKYQNE